MRIFLKQYKLQLIPISPLFVGSGEYYTAKEYVYDENKREYCFLDSARFYDYLQTLQHKTGIIDRYECFLLNKRPYKSGSRLEDFLSNEKILLSSLKSKEIIKYSISDSHFVYNRGKNDDKRLNEVHRFITDAYGNPYVPGSSLKGAIRTILCNQHFKTDNSKKDKNKIPWGGHNGIQFNDIFHNIRVSDSRPLSQNALSLVQKWDHSAQKARANALPLFREVICPETTIHFNITCEGEKAIRLMDNLMTMAFKHYGAYRHYFLSDFSSEKIQTYSSINGEKLPYIYVGGGTGFWTKTIINHANPSRHRKKFKTKMIKNGTMKLTKLNFKTKEPLINNSDSFFEMGKCLFKLTEK